MQNPIKQFIEESRLKPNHSEYATIIALLNVVKGVIEGKRVLYKTSDKMYDENKAINLAPIYNEALDDILKDLEIK